MKKVKVLVYMVLKEAVIEVTPTEGMSGTDIMSKAIEMVEKGQARLGPTDTRYIALPAE